MKRVLSIFQTVVYTLTHIFLALQNLDLDGEWDPEKYEHQMKGVYDDRYDGQVRHISFAPKYYVEQDFQDEEKPEWADDIDISDIVPAKTQKRDRKRQRDKTKTDKAWQDDAAVNVEDMDADAEVPHHGNDDEEWDGTEEMRKRKLDQYMEELYELEFNDLVSENMLHLSEC